ncbi:MAG: TlpA family protein disulfide reductase [Tannerella sp.]|jgi:thiol-disulfide isomerase/thioredoxin|nr:TlpA family protein disulfide reductase [Tannerella sp.]
MKNSMINPCRSAFRRRIKKFALICALCVICVPQVAVAGTIVVDHPPFAFNTHSNVTTQRITLTDTATVLDMVISARRQDWIRISSDSYITADGQKHMLRSADGIRLDTEVYPDESGKLVFSLIFPPIDPATKQIDFLESDCDGCFKTFGLALSPDAPMHRVAVPQKVKDAATVKDDGKPLPVPFLKPGRATLKGTLLGYPPAIGTTVNVYVHNPVTGIQEEYEVKVGENGAFELDVPLVADMQALLRLSAPRYNKYILLSPGRTSTVYFDLPRKSCRDTPIESLKCPGAKYVYFGGANAEINNQMEDIGLDGLLQKIYNDPNHDRIAEMTPEQYRQYTLDKMAGLTASLKEKHLTRKALEFATGAVRYATVSGLMNTPSALRSAFRRSRKLDYDDPELRKFVLPKMDAGFYSFLKELSINDPFMLYFDDCLRIIRSCKYLDLGGSGISFIPMEAWQAMIESGKLPPEDMEMAVYLRDNALDNPDAKEKLKSSLTTGLQEVINTGKLSGELLEEASRTLSIYADTSIATLKAMELSSMFMVKLTEQAVFTVEELTEIQKAAGRQDPTFARLETRIKPFHEKYFREIMQINERATVKEKRAALAAVLGADSGIAFDLLESQASAGKMEDFTPLTDDDLQPFAQKKNRFYFDYLTAKNKELLAKIEANKLKGGYTVHDVPETDGEQAFVEILKPFSGKVVLVDFWNTWCGPCLSAMKQFEATKTALKEKGVVFVYLADESSPVNAWNNMIPNIPGEHFRLKNAQMGELRKKFGIRGIPSYLILNRHGEQIYFKTGFYGAEIERIINEAL